MVDGGIAGADAAQSDAEVAPEDAGLPPPEEICPRPAGDLVRGDINGDGFVDVADPIGFENYLFRDGPDPVCRDAADVTLDNLIELDDATAIVSFLVPGTQMFSSLESGDCRQTMPWPEGQCAPLALDLLAPSRVTTTQFSARIALRSPTLNVQGWSMSIRSDGCTVREATTARTTAAEVWDDPPGIRHLGYSAAVPVSGGAIALAILSLTEPVALEAIEEAQEILRLELGATLPELGCRTCTLSFSDDLSWTGQPIRTAIAADGYAYPPPLSSAAIEICAE